jgi:hypothetical protein
MDGLIIKIEGEITKECPNSQNKNPSNFSVEGWVIFE